MDLSLLTTLRDKLIGAKDFTEVWAYFLDHFGEDREFMSLGERASNPLLETMLGHIARQLFGREVPVTDVVLLRVAGHSFLHGTATLGDKLATVIYCEEKHVGLLAVVWSLAPTETKLARFTGRPAPDLWNRSSN